MRRTTCSLTDKCEGFLGFERYKNETHKAEAPQAVYQILLSLTPPQREVVVLYLVDRLSADEISCELCIPKNTVYSRIHHAKKRLKENAVFFFRQVL